jgi:nitrate reductase molybdenum cofactor assembly chaperone NarJ/NarW
MRRHEGGSLGAATRESEHAVVYRIAALLLEYPDEALLARLPALQRGAATLSQPYRQQLESLLQHLGSTPLPELAADYVAIFDLRRRCCLYLTYYAFGDTRKRGQALLTFKQAYRAGDVELTGDELPDHLCVLLEFAATADLENGRRLLLDHRAGLELLRLALGDCGSIYVEALNAISATLPTLAGTDREAVARLAAEGPPGEDVGLEPFAPPDYMGART